MWNGISYQFRALPQGLSTSPRIFTKILKPVYATLRSRGHINIPYIDDSLLIGHTLKECEVNVHETVKSLDNLGFTIHPEKSVFNPTQKNVFLGFVINSIEMTVRLTLERASDLYDLCEQLLNKPFITIRFLAKL